MTDYQLRDPHPTNSIRFYNGTNAEERNEVLRISKDGVWANPNIPVDDAAKLVLGAVDGYVKTMVAQAVSAEREACAQLCERDAAAWGYDSNAASCAIAIRARGNT